MVLSVKGDLNLLDGTDKLHLLIMIIVREIAKNFKYGPASV